MIDGEALYGDYINYWHRNWKNFPPLLAFVYVAFNTFCAAFGDIIALPLVAVHYVFNELQFNRTRLIRQNIVWGTLVTALLLLYHFWGDQIMYYTKIKWLTYWE